MEKYCSKCGKELVKGECNCDIYEENVFSYIKNFIIKPIDTTNKFIEKSSNESSYIILLFTSLILSLCFTTIFKINIFMPIKSIISLSLIIYLTFLLFVLIINLINKYVIKKDVSYENIMKLVSISSISFIFFGIIYYLIFHLFNIVFIELFGLGILLFSINFTFCFNKISKIDTNKIPYLLISTILILSFILDILL